MLEIAVIVAGGSGSRMKSKLPKQFLKFGSLPILMHTIGQFRKYKNDIPIVLVLPDNQLDTWNKLCKKHQFNLVNLQVVSGGSTRFQSCKNGINSIKADRALVAIHDGVRPFVSEKIIRNGFELAAIKDTAVCCIESKDSARYLNNDHSVSLDRNRLRLVQTPQIFTLEILKKAYANPELTTFTDDASVVEHAGFKIKLFEGEPKNIKITSQEDLAIAKIFFKNEK